MVAQIILVSAQVQTKGGVRVLQAVTFELFSRVQVATASALNAGRNALGNYLALRGVRVQNQGLQRRGGGLGGGVAGGDGVAGGGGEVPARIKHKARRRGAGPSAWGDGRCRPAARK